MLARGIEGMSGDSFVAKGRRDINNAALALGQHYTQFMFHAQQHPEHVGFECTRVCLRGLRRDRPFRSVGSRVVYSYVEPAKAFNCLIDERPELWFVPNVDLHKL